MTTLQSVCTTDAFVRVSAYPLGILKGCASIDELDVFKDLPDGFLRVVLRLIKKINVATPTQKIFARRSTIAREAGKSEETVGRAIRWLETHGLITREQKARPGLRGSEAHLQPTHKLIDALGIGKAHPRSAELANQSAVNLDDSVSAKQKHSLIKKQSDEPFSKTDKNKKLSTDRKTVIIDGKVIPSELAWIIQKQDVSANALLMLMKIASNSGKRLSHVVQVAKNYLQKLKNRELISYIRSLLNQDKDYAFIAQADDNQAKADQKLQQDRELVSRKAEEWAGRRFQAKNGTTYVVEKNGYITLTDAITSKIKGGTWLDVAFVDAVIDGKLRQI